MTGPIDPYPHYPHYPDSRDDHRSGWKRRRWYNPASWFGRRRPLGAVTPVTVHGATDDFTFVTPALGEAYAFNIDIRCSWCATGTAIGRRSVSDVEHELRLRIDDARKDLRYGIESRVRETARRFLPSRPGDVEQALAASAATCFSDGDVTCNATARVWVTEAVRGQLERHTLNMVALDHRLEHGLKQVDVSRRLQHAWRGLLDEGLKDLSTLAASRREAWMAPYAMELAERPQDVAAVLRSMLNERIDHANGLLEQLGGMLQSGQHLDVYDFMLKSEIALRSTLEGLGVPVPPLQQGHPFGGEAAPDAPAPEAPAPVGPVAG